MTRVAVLASLSLLMTVGVYGLVAGIVKLDDLGQHFAMRGAQGRSALATLQRVLAAGILLAAPWLMRGLSVAGTIAMFLVGGGILTHAVSPFYDWVQKQAESQRETSLVGPVLTELLPSFVDLTVGVVSGTVVLGLWTAVQRLRGKPAH
jgi:predicted DNA repair protein MutK